MADGSTSSKVICGYAQQILPETPIECLKVFLAGPTDLAYPWRYQLAERLQQKLPDGTQILLLIPEPEEPGTRWESIEHGAHKYSPRTAAKLKDRLPDNVIRQISWESAAFELADTVVYNMCQHWTRDLEAGLHGNIGPTSRMELMHVHPMEADDAGRPWIFYNQEHGDSSKNTDNSVHLGGEQPGHSQGWLHYQIAAHDFCYVDSDTKLVDELVKQAIERQIPPI